MSIYIFEPHFFVSAKLSAYKKKDKLEESEKERHTTQNIIWWMMKIRKTNNINEEIKHQDAMPAVLPTTRINERTNKITSLMS